MIRPGDVFERLVVLERRFRRAGHTYYLCSCRCGEKTQACGSNLRSGHTASCGCWRREASTTHGHGKIGGRSPEYHAYWRAKYRCTNPNYEFYSHYGGRGIRFLFTTFEQFLECVGLRPEGHSLDRINNDGNYEPGNVRWATRELQSNNRRPWGTAKAA